MYITLNKINFNKNCNALVSELSLFVNCPMIMNVSMQIIFQPIMFILLSFRIFTVMDGKASRKKRSLILDTVKLGEISKF